MHVIKRSTLIDYCRQYPEASSQLMAWLAEAEVARWTCHQDVLEKYKTADFPTDHHVIFNIKGKKFRLVVRIKYANQFVNGTIFIRWFGPHKEYDKLIIERL